MYGRVKFIGANISYKVENFLQKNLIGRNLNISFKKVSPNQNYFL